MRRKKRKHLQRTIRQGYMKNKKQILIIALSIVFLFIVGIRAVPQNQETKTLGGFFTLNAAAGKDTATDIGTGGLTKVIESIFGKNIASFVTGNNIGTSGSQPKKENIIGKKEKFIETKETKEEVKKIEKIIEDNKKIKEKKETEKHEPKRTIIHFGGGGGSVTPPSVEQPPEPEPIEPPKGNYSKIYVSPETTEINKDNEFVMDLVIDTSNLVYGTEIIIKFNSSILEAVGIEERTFLKKDNEKTYPITKINNEEGEVKYVCTRFGVQTGVSGTGSLAEMKFLAKEAGETKIEIEEVSLVDTRAEKIENVETIDAVATVL